MGKWRGLGVEGEEWNGEYRRKIQQNPSQGRRSLQFSYSSAIQRGLQHDINTARISWCRTHNFCGQTL